jgi:hypothetical protein
MHRILAAFLVTGFLAATPSHAGNAEEQEVAREVGAVLSWRLGPESVEEWCRSADPEGVEVRKAALQNWLRKNDAQIKAVDARVAEVVPLLFPPSKSAVAVEAIQGQVKEILHDSLLKGKSADEVRAFCKAEADPKRPRWNNPGMPHVQLSLAALYDLKIRLGEKPVASQ